MAGCETEWEKEHDFHGFGRNGSHQPIDDKKFQASRKWATTRRCIGAGQVHDWVLKNAKYLEFDYRLCCWRHGLLMRIQELQWRDRNPSGPQPLWDRLGSGEKAGYKTGLVVTTRITDATPACFAAHVNQRGEEDRIAEQEVGDHPLGRVLDLILGGGRCHFLPNTMDGSCRQDDKDVVGLAKKNGFNYVNNRKAFDDLDGGNSAKLPLLGLLADWDIPYEVDRRNMDDIYPSLDEMARTALKALSIATQDSDQGFFLMIEGSRIDHAGHANDPVAQVHEVLAYDKAFASVLDFLDADDVEGVLVGTSDHETGGLATARRELLR